MSIPRRLAAVVLGAVAVLSVVGLSRVPYRVDDGSDARLRLSWRIRGEAVEACRTLTEEELAELPVHMRNPEVCQQRGRAYRLRVWVDGDPLVERTVEPAGARGDRPVYVFLERPLTPGRRELRVSFEPVGGDEPDAGLRYRGAVEVAPREVVLVTLGTDASGEGYLEARTSLR